MTKDHAKVSWEDIGRLRHSLSNDHMYIMGIWKHLNDYHRTVHSTQDNIVDDVKNELLDFNCLKLTETMGILDEIILKNDRRKQNRPIDNDRRKKQKGDYYD